MRGVFTAVVLAFALLLGAPASAAVLVSNIDQTPASTTTLLSGAMVSQAFTTGSNSTGYTLTSIEVKFATAPNAVRVRLLNVNVDGTPGTTEIVRLNNPSSLTAGNLTFTVPPAGTTLAANTTYAVAVDMATSGTLSEANVDAIDSGGATGWSIATQSITLLVGWVTSNFEILIRVNGTVNPPPSVFVSNIAQPTHATEGPLATPRAQLFTTGSNPTGYTLASVEAKFGSAPNSSLRVRILDVVGGRPGTTEIVLNNPPSLAAGNLTFIAPLETTLAAGTSYAVAVDSATTGTIRFTESDAEDAGGESDWSIADEVRTGANFGGINHSIVLQIRVSGTANPVVLVSNTGQSPASGDVVGIDGTSKHELAVAFTTGSSEGGYTLSEVDVRLGSVSSDANPKVSIYSTSSGNPDSSRHVLTNPASVANGDNTFTAAADATLDANTTYALVFQQTGESGSYRVWGTASGDDAGTCGWGIADKLVTRDTKAGTPAWTAGVRTVWMGLKGRVADTTPPTLVSALVNGATLTLTFDDCLGAAASLANGAFAVKKAGPGDTDVDVNLSTAPAVSGNTVVLTLASALGSTDRGFTVSYTQPDSGTANRIVNEAGLAADSFSEQAVPRVLVSNLGRDTRVAAGGLAADNAQPFTAGSNPGGYKLTHAAIKLKRTSATATPTYTVSVHSDSSSNPGDRVGTQLTNPGSLPTTTTDVIFTATGGLDLTANTEYWLVWDTGQQNSATGTLEVTTSDAEDTGPATGWSLGDGSKSRAFGATAWPATLASDAYQIALYGHIKPQPMVTDVQISSTPSHPETYTYGLGSNIQVQVTFDRAVTVSGTPRLQIDFDSAAGGEKWADFEGGSDTKVLTFGYEVVAADRSTQGVAVLANTLQLNGGTIKDAGDATVNANLAHPERNHDANHKVDGSLAPDETPPAFSSATVNERTLTVTFKEGLDSASAPAGDAFTVSGGRTGTGTASLSGATATVTLNTAVPHGEQMVTVSYTNPGTGNSPLRDGSGNEVQDFSGQPVTNNTPSPGGSGNPRGGGNPSGGGRGGSSGRDRHGNTAATATPIAFRSASPRAGSLAGQINTQRDVDYFRLRLAQAGVLLIETNGRTDTRGQVWQAGEALGAATGGGPGTNFRLVTPVAAGDVLIAIAGEGGRTGAYTLRARLVVGSVENPSPTSFQSGLGVISGWVCEAEGVTVEIEKEDGAVVALAAAYGTARADTATICGDSDNGFGVLFNWNLLDDGAHAVRVLVNGVALGTRVVPGIGVVPAVVDGIEIGRAPVTVTTLGAEFIKGLQGSFLVADFPQAGEQVRVVWQESQQNFVLAPTELGAVLTPAPSSGGIEGVLENPTPASYQSGIGVISGWVCVANEVVIEINGQAIAAAAGTERGDTLDVCGDVDTGFGLLVNWAEFGAGAHEVVALVDGVELSRATVTVTLVDAAEPFVRGLTKRVELAGFPTPDETVTLEWQESQQNFVITGVE